jgi:serine/threonine-protein kinase
MSQEKEKTTLAAMSDPTPSLEAKAIIANRYEVLGLLGVGGMGAVYKVRDTELDELVALKMLKRELATPALLERFRREVKLARKVTHKNVARTFDLGEHEGERFLTMELVDGEALSTVVAREGKLSLSRVADLVGPICEGLSAAHVAGVVHRDFKPDNVLIAKDGRVVLTDFGIARAEGGDAQRTQIPLGTPAYMAPEQVEAGVVDARADIYALGAVLFELLTGRLPWEGETVYAVAAMRLIQPPPDPRKHRPDLPAAVAELVMRCMARKPEDRPPTAADVATRFVNVTLPADSELISRSIRVQQAPVEQRTEPGQKTIAVLPFRNAGPAEDEYLADGLTDDLIDALSMTPGLRVRPRGVVMGHKQGDPRAIGRDLDVQVVVDGSVRTIGDALRVTARVLSVADGFQLWARRFDGKRADILSIGDEVARAISGALTVAQGPERAKVENPKALDLYLRGRHEFFRMWSDAIERAIGLLKEAHELAPNDPIILSGYSLALARRFGVGINGEQRVELARTLANRALEIAPNLAEAHAALAAVAIQHNDVAEGARLVRKALELSPLLVDAHEQAARLSSETDATIDAIVRIEHAMHLEPRLSNLRYVKARVAALVGEWDDVDRVFATPPSDSDDSNLYWMSQVRMATWSRDRARIQRVIEGLDGTAPFAFQSLVRGLGTVALTGVLPEGARGFLEERSQGDITPRTRSFFRQLQAETLAVANELDGVLEATEKAVDAGLFDLLWLDRCPLLEPVRKTERFVALRPRVLERSNAIVAQLVGPRRT